jgi:ribosomal protein S13
MIGRITGTLLEKNPPQILVDAGGIGYEVDVPMSTFYNLPNLGEKVALVTHLAVREDAHLLYGFLTEGERSAFRQLLKISGIGARTALAVLSGLSVNELAQAVALQETGRLTKIPGIGKKTARTQGQTFRLRPGCRKSRRWRDGARCGQRHSQCPAGARLQRTRSAHGNKRPARGRRGV